MLLNPFPASVLWYKCITEVHKAGESSQIPQLGHSFWMAPLPSELSFALSPCSAKLTLISQCSVTALLLHIQQVLSGWPSPNWIKAIFDHHTLFVPGQCVLRKKLSAISIETHTLSTVGNSRQACNAVSMKKCVILFACETVSGAVHAAATCRDVWSEQAVTWSF